MPEDKHRRAARSNAAALRERAGEVLWMPDGHPVLLRAGRSLGEAGLVALASDYFDELNVEANQYLGPDHPHTLTTRHNLTYWRGEAGDAATALDRLRVLGPDHPTPWPPSTTWLLAERRPASRTGDHALTCPRIVRRHPQQAGIG